MAEGVAATFLRLVIKQSVIMPSCTVFAMREQKRRVDTIRFGSRVLKAGTTGAALPSGSRVKPDIANVELDTVLFKAAVMVEDEVFEDNIEEAAMRNTILQLLGEAVSRDVEYVVIQSADNSTDPLLAQLPDGGILHQASSHPKDAGGARLSKDLLSATRKAIPHEYKINPLNMRIWTSVNAADDFEDSLSDRATPLGDKMIEDHPGARFKLTPVVAVPEFPEDQGIYTNYTTAVMLDPKNVHIGFHKRVEVRSAEDIESGCIVIVARLRMDMKYANEDAVGYCHSLLAS